MTFVNPVLPKSTIHNHCTFCDGKNTAVQMALKASELGFTDFGMSCHGQNRYEPFVGVGEQQASEYVKEIKNLNNIFMDRIKIYCGIEQDFYSPISFRDKIDYLIGSVHDIYDEKTGEYYYVDGDEDTFNNCINNIFGGDAMLLVEHFYKLTCENALKYKPDIIGHLDLVVKNNKNNKFFNEQSIEYKNIVLDCVNEISKTESVFELNTGGLFRNYRETPYPDNFILKHMCEINAKVTISSDAHSEKAVGYLYEEAKQILKSVGFNYFYVWYNGGFFKQSINI